MYQFRTLSFLIALFLSACAGHKELTAPCNFDLSQVETSLSSGMSLANFSVPCEQQKPINA